MARNDRSISVERVIAAPPQQIFDVLADPARHADFDGSDTVKRAQRAPARLSRAAWFVHAAGFPARNRKGMEATLERLAYLVEQGTPYTRWSSPEG